MPSLAFDSNDRQWMQSCVYTRETVIAEKLEAMVSLGQLNSRMKVFFDLWLLSQTQDFEGRILVEAILRTFSQRRTQVVADPICFTDDFAKDPTKIVQWAAFVRNMRLSQAPAGFEDIIQTVQAFLRLLLHAISENADFSMRWHAGGSWNQM